MRSAKSVLQRLKPADVGGFTAGLDAPPYKALGFDDAFESVLNLVMRKLCAWLVRGECYVGEPPGGRLPLRMLFGRREFGRSGIRREPKGLRKRPHVKATCGAL